MNAQRIIDLVGGAVASVVLLLIVVNVVRDPLAKDRAWLEEQLKAARLVADNEASADSDFAGWQKSIADKPELWRAISKEPAKPAPPPPAACKPPSPDDLIKKVKEEGIKFSRSQIGEKIKVVIGDNKRGEFHVEGDTVKEFTLKSFDRTGAKLTFDFKCPDKSTQTIEFTVPRE